MKRLIEKNIVGKKVFILFILTNSLYAIMLTITIPSVMSFSGGMRLLDMIPSGYNAKYVDLLFNTLGTKGRHAYLFYQIPIDMVYPLFFGISNCLVLAYILNKLGKLNSYLFFLCFLPLLSGLFDYIENIGIIAMLLSFPDNLMVLSQTTNVFSVLKSSFTTLYFISLITSLIILGKYKLSRSKFYQSMTNPEK